MDKVGRQTVTRPRSSNSHHTSAYTAFKNKLTRLVGDLLSIAVVVAAAMKYCSACHLSYDGHLLKFRSYNYQHYGDNAATRNNLEELVCCYRL